MAATKQVAFVPPTLSQIKEYFRALNAESFAHAFYERYTANGWTVSTQPSADTNWVPGRRPMRNWKQSATKWLDRQRVTTYRQRNSR